MDIHPRHGLSLCAGGGGLDMGLMLAEPGFHTRCFVEWEEYPRDSLIAGQRAGYLAPAPIWDDVKTFDGRPWRGAIDTVLAGYPCQPFSAAGQRKGADDPRHLWPDVARIIREVEPEWVFLENVAGHLTLGLEAVLGELRGMGWTPAVGAFSAAEVGAPHERLRVFIVAHNQHAGRQRGWVSAEQIGWKAGNVARHGGKMANTNGGHPGAEREQRGGKQRLLTAGGGIGASDVVYAAHPERRQDATGRHISDGSNPGRDQTASGSGKSDEALDNATSARCDGARIGAEANGQGGKCVSGDGCDDVGNAAGIGCGEGRAEPVVRSGRNTSASTGGAMANASSPEYQGQQPGKRNQGRWQVADGYPALSRGTGIFPPGPGDAAAWADALAIAPDLAPATGLADCIAWAGRMAASMAQSEQAAAEPDLRRMAHGLATRARALRLLGNGVHPLAAAHAWRTLATAHGLGAVDMDADSGATNAKEFV